MKGKSLTDALHDIQSGNKENYIPEKDTLTISEKSKVSLSKVYGFATFYSMFSVKPRGKHIIRVCKSLSCHMGKAEEVIEKLEEVLGVEIGETTEDGEFTLEESSCLGMCSVSPAMMIDKIPFGNLTVDQIPEIIKKVKSEGSQEKIYTEQILPAQGRVVLKSVGVINPESIDEYIASRGYLALKKAIENGPQWVINELKKSELRGRGGAGFPTGRKWEFTAKAPGPQKYLICNADEGEPGTFKDRVIMEGDPHSIIEGMIIAAFATGCNNGYIYIRGEYDLSIRRIEKAIGDARSHGFLGRNILGSGFPFDIEIHKGAGSYVVGEETTLMESIEGHRGEPRKKPPYPPTFGLLGKPTVINNVETLANVPPIITNGADWYRTIRVPESYGTKLFSLSGDVNWKGVIEAPFGTRLSYIVNELGGGVRNGKKLRGVIFGGVSGTLLTPDQFDIPVDFNSLVTIEAGPGSGSIIVMDETRSIVNIAKNIAYFFKYESCGKCTPCRIGTEQLMNIIDRILEGSGKESDLEVIERLGQDMRLTSFCPLGQTAPNIIVQSIQKFRSKWLEHMKDKKLEGGGSYER